MVDAVRRRRVQHVLEPAELGDPFGMDPELVDQVELQGDQHGHGLEAEQHDRREEDGGAGELAEPAQPIGCRQGEAVRRVMNRMSVPEPAYRVAGAMEPVVEELETDEEQQHATCRIGRQREQATVVGPEIDRCQDAERRERKQPAHCHVAERRRPFLPVVALAARAAEPQPLDQGAAQHQRQQDRVELQDGTHPRLRLLRCTKDMSNAHVLVLAFEALEAAWRSVPKLLEYRGESRGRYAPRRLFRRSWKRRLRFWRRADSRASPLTRWPSARASASARSTSTSPTS